MYFVTKIVNPADGLIDNHNFIPGHKDEYNYTKTGFHQYLHAIDIATGIEKSYSPVEITATIGGTGDGNNAGQITFEPRRQFNRAGLVLSNAVLYVTFAAHCDFNPSHGWVLSYNTSNLTLLHAFNATPNDGRGGSWMSGSAPAVDENGNLYLTTGNSLSESGSSTEFNTYTTSPAVLANRGESVIELTPNLTVASFFTPFTYLALNDADKDFGTQVMLIPKTNLAMTGCKDDTIYVMNKNNLGGFDATKNNVQQTVFVHDGATMHSSFAYFGGTTPFAYQFSENSSLMAYPVISSGLGASIPNTGIVGPNGGSGGYLSVSSNGADPSTGILWAYHAQNGCNANGSDCHGILHAVNASDVTKELWNSDMSGVDNISVFNKMSCPTVALGKVYIPGNKNYLLVYGLKTNTSCVTDVALGKPAFASSGVPVDVGCCQPTFANDGNSGTRWSSDFSDLQYIYIDLSARYDICKMAIKWETAYGKDFDLQVSEDAVTWTTVDTVRGNASTNTEFNGACSGKYVRMQGIKRGTGYGYSIFDFQVFGNPASSCPTPTGLSAANLTPNSEQISWNAVTGANQYIIKYRPDLSSSWISKTSNTNSITLTALSCGTLYYYTVQAACATDNSTVSPGSFSPSGCSSNSCDQLPVRYYNVDLGDIGVAGSVCKTGSVYTLSGSGTDIGAVSDEFQFVYTSNDIADYEVYGRVTLQDQISASNKLGILIRDSLSNTSRFAYIASVSNGNNIVFEYRDVPGGATTKTTLSGHPLPYWFKLSKLGTYYSAYTSTDGISWTLVGGPVDLQFGTDPTNAPHYGMAITSADNTKLSTGKIDNFTVAGSSTLPIRLLSFSAKSVNQDHVLISWATSMEQHVDHFEVQRSVGNTGFQAIEKIKAVGESETPQYYSVNDNQPATGINYYRLKELDTDGGSYFTPVISVNFDEQEGPDVYPNPASAYVNITSHRDPILEVTVFDVAGKAINNIHYAGGQTSVKLNTASLAQGMYIITIKTTSKLYQQKFAKQ